MFMLLRRKQLLELLKRTCPLLTNAAIRRTPYLSLVKSQLTVLERKFGHQAIVTFKAKLSTSLLFSMAVLGKVIPVI